MPQIWPDEEGTLLLDSCLVVEAKGGGGMPRRTPYTACYHRCYSNTFCKGVALYRDMSGVELC